ncbi:MAG: ATP-binding protein [Arenicellales bacterium]
MYRKWIRSLSLWLTLVASLLIVVAFAVSTNESTRAFGRFVVIAACSMMLAILVGIGLAERARRLLRSFEDQDRADGDDASLSVAQAATYRDLFENATDIVFTTDLSGHFVAGNKAVEHMLGYTVEEAKSLTWEKLVAPYDLWKAKQMYKRHAAGEKRVSFELDVAAASGEIKTFEIGSRPMFRDGKLCGFHGIARDTTSRRRIEKQLESARHEAEAANEAKSTFLANMSHEIRTPINGILGFLSLFAKTSLTPRQKEYLVPIEESAKHLLKIINDILDLSKIEAGGFSIDNEIFNFRDVVGSAVALLRPMGESKGLMVTVDFDQGIPDLVVGDGTRIGQVVSNLVNNAIKFTDAGSVRVTSRVRDAASSRVSIEVGVRDTGIGIAPADQTKLFEPFQQLDVTPHRKYGGAGLGLTISRDLVEAMGGRIQVESRPGEYTEFVFEIPLGLAPDNRAATAGEAQDSSHRFNGAGLSALIIDDNEINRWYLGAVLDQYDFQVRDASSGGAALTACRDRTFDVVFMDIHMADMDGIETTRRLRAQLPRYRQIPFVAVSADVIGHGGARFTGQGLDHFLAKPVKEESLVALLSDVFPGRDAKGSAGVGGALPAVKGGEVLDRGQGLALAANNEGLWRRGVDALRRQCRDALPRMRGSLRAGDYANVRQHAHKLAGSAGYVAAGELARCARALEQAARLQRDVSVEQCLADLDCAVERLLALDIDTPA